MYKNYDSLRTGRDTCLSSGMTHSTGSPPIASFKAMFKSWQIMLLVFLSLTIGQQALAQSTANYVYSTNTTGSMALDMNGNAIDMSTGTTQLYGGGVDTYTNPGLQTFGFQFYMMGTPYTQWNVNPDGQLRLGTTLLTGHVSDQTTAPVIIVNNVDGKTDATTGKVHFKIQGASPNRVLIVEWKNVLLNWNAAGSTLSSYQLRLYETTNIIETVYGSMWNSSAISKDQVIGFASGATAGSIGSLATLAATPTYVTNGTSFAITNYPASAAMANLNGLTDGSRRVFRFTPTIVGTPSTPITFSTTLVAPSTMSVNWVDDSTTETFFTVGRSNSPGGPFTIIGSVNSTTIAATGAPYSLPITGLSAGTTHYFEIKAMNESGGTSPVLTGSQATLAAAVYTWNATAGTANWTTPTSWTPDRNTPDAADILQFTNGGSSIVTGIPTQTVGNIVFGNNTTTSFQSAAAATLTTAVGLTIPAGSTLLSDGSTAALTMAYTAGAINTIDGKLEIINSGFANAVNFTNSVTTVGTTGTLAAGGILAGPITSTATNLIINGTYNHKYTTANGTIPTAKWNPGSNTNIIGYTATNMTPSGLAQTFNNFTWNCTGQGANNYNLTLTAATFNVTDTFSVLNTGATGSLRLGGTGSYTINVGNYFQSAGIFELQSGASGTPSLNVAGLFNQTAGIFRSTGTGTANSTLNFNGASAQVANFFAQPTGPITYRFSNPAGVTINGNWGTNFAVGNGTLGGLRVSTISATPATFGGTLTNFQYNAANTTLTYDATGSYAARATEYPTVSGPANLTVGVGANNVLTLPFNRTIPGTLTMTSGEIDVETNTLILGTSAAAPGTLSYTAGGIKMSTGAFTRWFGTSGLPTAAGTGIGFFPLSVASNNRNASVSFSTATALSAGGTISASHNNGTGVSPTGPFNDGAFVVDTRSNCSWAFTTGNGITASGTVNVRLTSGNAFGAISNTNLRIVQAAGAVGTHASATGSAPNFQAIRTALTLAQLAQTHYIGAGSSDISNVVNSIAAGDWNTPSTWSTGLVPTCGDLVSIGHAVTVSSATNSSKSLTINAAGILTVVSGDLTVGCTNNDNSLNVNGTLTVTGGLLKVNGNFNLPSGGKLNQSGGTISVDGNNGGSAVGSVAAATVIVQFSPLLVADISLTGGTFIIVDPHTGTADTFQVACAGVGMIAASGTHTFKFGDGVSTDNGSATGFNYNSWNTNAVFAFNHVILETVTAGTNRFLLINNNQFKNFICVGDLTINTGAEFRNTGTDNTTGANYIGGNIVNSGTFTALNTVFLSNTTSPNNTTINSIPATAAQTVSGTGVFRNLIAAPTANLTGLTVNNGNVAGVTLSVPISVSGTLTLTAGLVHTTDVNAFKLGTATVAGTLSGGSSTAYINGPFTRTIANGNANSNYLVFPIGTVTSYAPVSIAPATTSVASFKAQAFSTNSGTMDPSIANLSTTRRWEIPLVSGTITNINVKLGSTGIVSTNIPVQAPTAAGIYTNAFGSTATFAAGPPPTTQSNTPVLSANYTGFISYSDSNACSGTPAPGNTLASATTICSGSAVTFSLQNVTTGSGVTYVWESSPDGINYSPINLATGTTYTVVPVASDFYRAQVTCSGNTTPSTGVQVTFANSITGTTPGSNCGTGTVSLAATGGAGTTVKWYAAPTGGDPIASGSPFVTPLLTNSATYYAAAETGSSLTLGAGGTTSSSTAQSFFPGGWGGAKTQYIIKASELSALGITNITSLGFEPTTSGQTYQGFFVSMGNTTDVTAPSITFISTGLTKVYAGTEANNGFTPVANTVNTLAFGTGGTASSFVWDGTSNIVISISWSRVPAAGTSTASSMKVDDVGFASSAYRQRDNVTPAAMETETSVNSTSTLRPKFRINELSVCSSPRVAVPATITSPPVFALSVDPAAICSGQTTSAVTIVTGASDYDTYNWAPASGVSGNPLTGWTFNPSVTTTYTLTASQSAGTLCSTTANVIVTVNAIPDAIVIAPVSAPAVCTDAIQALATTGGMLSNASILSENFNGVTNNWTTVNNSTGGTPAAIAWTLRPDGFTYGTFATWHSNDNSQFYMTNGDAGGFGSVSATLLQSPSFSTAGFADVNLKFFSYLFDNAPPSSTVGKVQASLDGSVWADVHTVAIIGPPNVMNFVPVSIDLPAAYVNKPTVYVRFNYAGSWRYFWGIDNVSITGTKILDVTWSPTTNLYSDAAATVPYVALTNAPTVYFKSGTAGGPATYTATSITGAMCQMTKTVDVTVVDKPQITGASGVCINATTSLSATTTPAVANPWTSSTPAVASVDASGVVTGHLAGGATITYTNINGCTHTHIITVNPLPVMTSVVSSVCVGSTITLTASTTPAVANAWVSLNTSVATVDATTGVVTGVSMGQTDINYTNINGCMVTQQVTVNALPTLTITNPAVVCSNATIDLTAAAITAGSTAGVTLTYWTDAMATVALGTPGAVSSPGATYYIKATNTVSSCSVIQPVVVTFEDCSVGWANLQHPGSATINTCGSLDAYAKVWKNGVTDVAGASADIQVWIGYSNADTNPNTWTNWVSATFNGQIGNDDEYKGTLTGLPAGTYYYASRIQYKTGAYQYGGYVLNAGGFWDGTTNVSGVLTVQAVATPTAAPTQVFCNGATVASLAATGTGIQWYAGPSGGSPLAGTDVLTSTNYYVSQTISSCESARVMVAVTVNTTPVPTAAATQVFCNSATVASLAATGTAIQWYAGPSGGSPLAGTDALSSTNYYVSQTVSSCESARVMVSVTVNVTPAPTGAATQDYNGGDTLADFTVVGTGIKWYDAANNGVELPDTTLIVSGTVYYASQTIGGCESIIRLAVTAGVDLEVPGFDKSKLTYYPNPVVDVITINYTKAIEGVEIYNMLGQKVYQKQFNAQEVKVDMSNLAAGNYVVNVISEGMIGNIKLVKR